MSDETSARELDTEGQARVAPRDVRQLVLEGIAELDRAERAGVRIEPDHGREKASGEGRGKLRAHTDRRRANTEPPRNLQRLHLHRLGGGHCREQATPEAHARPGKLQDADREDA
jgi:hypothetical protein